MSREPETAATAHDDQADPSGARAESCACSSGLDLTAREALVLDELTEIGMTIARSLKDEALARATVAQALAARVTAGEPAVPVPAGDADLARSFGHVSRAVRLTLALKSRLVADRLAVAAQRRLPAIEAAKKQRRKRQIIEAMEQLVETEARETGRERDVENLRADLRERLDDAEMEQEILDKGVGRVLIRICRDLGIASDWRPWRGTSWYHEEGWTIPGAGAAAAEDPDKDDEDPDEDGEAPMDPAEAAEAERYVAGLKAQFGVNWVNARSWKNRNPLATDWTSGAPPPRGDP
ncbi:MAG TPA: hypothetical protein VM689_01300 [Aliidongia sp.]|nr:hypothetical protein [Aliidongia sp.]